MYQEHFEWRMLIEWMNEFIQSIFKKKNFLTKFFVLKIYAHIKFLKEKDKNYKIILKSLLFKVIFFLNAIRQFHITLIYFFFDMWKSKKRWKSDIVPSCFQKLSRSLFPHYYKLYEFKWVFFFTSTSNLFLIGIFSSSLLYLLVL